MDHLREGSVAPDFELQSAVGESFILSSQAQKAPVLLAFYKSACPTCQFTFPFIQQIYEGFVSGSRPVIWGVSQDDVTETRRFSDEIGIQFPVLVDEHPYPVSVDYEIQYVPTLYLIDRDGQIKLADFGFSKPALRFAAEYLADELSQPTPVLFSEQDQLPERRPG